MNPSPSTHSFADLPDVDVPVEVLRLANQLIPSEPEEGGLCLLLTSAGTAEGKTTIARHLARALSKLLGQRVLLGDLQEPSDQVHDAPGFAPTSLAGLTQLLLPRECPDADIFQVLQRMLPELRTRYDVILLEGPPVLKAGILDSVVMSRLFDRVLLLFQEKTTPMSELKESVALLEKAGAKNIALLANQSSALERKIPRWNLLARIPRFFARLRRLKRRLFAWWKKRSQQAPPPDTTPQEREP